MTQDMSLALISLITPINGSKDRLELQGCVSYIILEYNNEYNNGIHRIETNSSLKLQALKKTSVHGDLRLPEVATILREPIAT